MGYGLYRAVVSVLIILVLPFFPVFLLSRKIRYRMHERLAFYPSRSGSRRPLLWLHAASVGEMQAVRPLLAQLLQRLPDHDFVLTCTTEQGHKVAQKQLPKKVLCFLAPLDVPWLVRRAINLLQPDLYVCLETELWPCMLTEVRRAGILMALANGRMSARAHRRYRRFRPFMQELLAGFKGIAVIGEKDRNRFVSLGVDANRIQVTGNSKFDFPARDLTKVRGQKRKQLGLADDAVLFIAGSTRSGEEALLLDVYRSLREQEKNLYWLLAPRHLERVGLVGRLLQDNGFSYDLLSEVKAESRTKRIVLVDSMGELSDLYAAGDFVFCGGSLVEKGGHNIMEVVRWGRPVYFGPHMKDFQEAAALLLEQGAGFQVKNPAELTQVITNHMHNVSNYRAACDAAARLVEQQQGAAARQADVITNLLTTTA